MSFRIVLLYAVLALGCATGGSDQPNQQIDAAKKDAPGTLPPDSSMPPIDAPAPPIDAPQQMVDAAMPDAPSGPFCAQNSECTVAGECCITLGGPMGFCGPGTVIGGFCFPQ